MVGGQVAEGGFFDGAAGGYGPKVEMGGGALEGSGVAESCLQEGGAEDFFGESAVVRHVEIARRERGAVAEDDVEGRDGSGGRDVGGIGELVVGDEGGDGAEIGAGDDGESVGAEDAEEFGEGDGDFVGVEVLDVVGGEEGIDAGGLDGLHVGDGAEDVGLDVGVDVEAELGPVGAGEGAGGAVFAGGSAADVEEGFGHEADGICLAWIAEMPSSDHCSIR